MAKRTPKDFSRKQIYKIATEYANTNQLYSRDYFSREYGISYSTFYKLLERAVIESIVDDKTVQRMSEKAAYNSAGKAGDGAKRRSTEHYEYLQLKRKIYILPKEESVAYAKKYANSGFDKKSFCAANFIDTKLFDRTVSKTIIENWVDDEVVEKIRSKSLQNNSGEKVFAFWEKLLSFRNENKKNQG